MWSYWAQKIGIWTVTLAAMIGAIYLAQAVVEQNSLVLFVMVVTVLGLLYLLRLYRYTWQIALFLESVGFVYAPLGFKISPIEISAVLVVALLATTWWRRDLAMTRSFRQEPAVIIFFISLTLLLIYAVGHFYFYWRNPFNPAEYSVRNSLKQTFQSFMPLFIVFFAMLRPGVFKSDGRALKTLSFIILTCLILDIGVKCYSAFIQGPGVIGNGESTFLFVGGINLMENVYILRALGPFAVLLGAFLLMEHNRRAKYGMSKIMPILMVLLGFVGSALSGGRLALISSVLFFTVATVVKRRIIVLFITGVFCLGTVAAVSIFSEQILPHDIPEQIKRPLYLISLDKKSNALQEVGRSIASSSEWRKSLFDRAMTEWQSHPIITWFGRDVYAYNYNDLLEVSLKGGYEGSMDSSLRRGATHNLIADLLLTYGLVGAVLYGLVLMAMVCFLVLVLKKTSEESGRQNIVWITFISLIYWVLFAIIGGTYFPNNLAWLVTLCIGMGNDYYANHKGKGLLFEAAAGHSLPEKC